MSGSATSALATGVRIASVGYAVAALEQLATRHAFLSGGPFSRRVVSQLHPKPLGRSSDTLFFALLVTQVAASTILVGFGPVPVAGRAACIIVTGSMLLVQWRRTLAGDGAEQLGILVAIATLVCFVPTPSESAASVAAAFLTAQLVLSYATAGAVKLTSEAWRRRPILAEILATHRFGSPRFSGFLRDHRRTCQAIQWLVIALEVLFPLAVIAPFPIFLGFVIAGLAFHTACAVLMGLNNFVWPFAATYPSLLFVWSRLSPAT
jgi:hypothetical protein